MRIKLASLMMGAVAAVVTFTSGMSDGDLTARRWIALILFCLATFAGATLAFYHGNRFLHKHGWSLFDDEDFDE